MIGWTILWLTWSPVAEAVSPEAVRSQTGWKDRGERKTDVGQVRMWSQAFDDAYCVRVGMDAPATVERLLEVASDIPSATSWSTQNLVTSEVLERAGSTVHYWQYLEVPSWLLVADRYWVVRGETEALPDKGVRFTWVQLPPTAHPAADAAARARSDQAIRVPVTIGEWTFEPRPDGAWATYTNCADPGGRLPDWVVRFAATRTVPDNLADLVREAVARGG